MENQLDKYEADDAAASDFSSPKSWDTTDGADSGGCTDEPTSIVNDKTKDENPQIESTLNAAAFQEAVPSTSKMTENQKTPHSSKHKAHRKKNKQLEDIQSMKRERSTPAVIIKFSNYEDVWSNMVNKEEVTKKSRNSKIFADRTTYLPRMRAILLDWIMEVCEVYHLRRTTYYLSIDYIDRYLTLRPSVPKTQLQLLGVSCLFIAAKMEEIYPPKLSEFSYVCDGACTETEILNCEILLLTNLQWDVNPMTPTTWLNLYMQIYSTDGSKEKIEIDAQNNFHFPQYSAYQFVRASHLIDLFSMDPGFLRFSYSIIAAGAMFYIFGELVAVSVSGYEWKQLEACVQYMSVFNRIINESMDARLQSICPQDLDESQLGNFRFLKKRIKGLITNEAHCMQTHVVDLDFFERATLLRLEQLGMRVEKTLVKRKKKVDPEVEPPRDLEESEGGPKDPKNEATSTTTEETTVVMYEIEKILDEQVNKCYDIFELLDEKLDETKSEPKTSEDPKTNVIDTAQLGTRLRSLFDAAIISPLLNREHSR